MNDRRCLNCGGELGYAHPGSRHYVCQRCGRLYDVAEVAQQAEVIDVHAEPLNEEEEEEAPSFQPHPPHEIIPAHRAERETGSTQATPPFYVHIERRVQGGPGCCSCGCLLLLLMAFLMLRGCAGLF